MNYFKLLCFFWAFIGLSSRVVMFIMGEKWKVWELNSAYKSKKPLIINLIAILGLIVVIYSWYNVIVMNVKYSWIIALLVTTTTIKISAILFNYDSFRKFAVQTLNNKNKMFQLNISIIIFSTILILMGIFLY